MRQILAVLFVALIAVGTAAEASPKPKSMTVAFAATGGTQHDVVTGSFRAGPTCSGEVRMVLDYRDLAWKAKWSHVRLPTKRKPVTARVRATITGYAKVDSTTRADPGCGPAPANPAEHCEGPIAVTGQAKLTVRRTAKGYAVEADAPDDSQEGEDEGTVVAEGSQSDCEASLRTAALHAEVALPRKASRAVVIPVDSAANDTRDEERRQHAEEHETVEGGQFDYVSDVAWSGIVTTRFNRNRK